jgi:RNA polymerase sigma-70 factor (ECF subfamily)
MVAGEAIGVMPTYGNLLAQVWSAANAPSADADAMRSDERLMLDYRGGDAHAFEVLYRRHCDRLHRYALRMAHGGDAEEIFQETWIAVIRGRERYAPDARFTTWLYSIAHRRAVDRLRAQWRAATQDESSLLALEALVPEPPEIAWSAAAAQAMQVAIQSLPAPQREAFLLHTEAELSLDEIALATAAPRETVKSRLRYAHRRLREALEAWR